MKTFRVGVVHCDDQHCREDGRYFIMWDGMKAGPFCLLHAKRLVKGLGKEGYRKEHRGWNPIDHPDHAVGVTKQEADTLREILGHLLDGHVGTDIFTDAEEFRTVHGIVRTLDRLFPGEEYGTTMGMKRTLKELESRKKARTKRRAR